MRPQSPILLDIPEDLRGPRVRLRPYQPDDAHPYWEALQESREQVAQWLPWIHDYQSLDDARSFVIRSRARWMLREDLTMGIFEAASDRFLGGCGLHRMDWNLGTFDSGYWLRSTAQGHGFMREAVTLLTRLAFDELKANRVQIRMDTRNLRSRRVAEEVGYHFEGTLRMSIPSSDGRPGDQHVFALTPEDYRNLNGVAWEG